MSLRMTLRLMGPLLVAMEAGIEFVRYGALPAAVAAYVTLVVAAIAVLFWGRYQLWPCAKTLGRIPALTQQRSVAEIGVRSLRWPTTRRTAAT